MDRRTHGILTEKYPAQTYCGLATTGRKTTHDPFQVDCEECRPVMRLMGILPDISEPNQPRGRGRPSEKKKGVLFRR